MDPAFHASPRQCASLSRHLRGTAGIWPCLMRKPVKRNRSWALAAPLSSSYRRTLRETPGHRGTR